MSRRFLLSFSMLLLVIMIGLAGCSSGNVENANSNDPVDAAQEPEASAEVEEQPEPVELTLFIATGLTDDEYIRWVEEPIKQKYPHITLKVIRKDETNTADSLVVSGTFPDLIYDSGTNDWERLELIEYLDDLIAKHNFDTSVIVPSMQNSSKNSQSKWDSFPVAGNFVVLWLNLDVFDTFGVEAPTGLMTWEEIIRIGGQLTRMHDGTQYIGIWPDYHFMARGMSVVDYIDPETERANVNHDVMRRIFTTAKQAFDQPGFIQEDGNWRYRRNEWLNDRNVGMVIATGNQMIGPLTELHDAGTPMNWDMAPFPNFEEKLGIGPSFGAQQIILSNKSEHKDDAFKVMAHLMSEEVQSIISGSTRVPTIENENVEKNFGSDYAAIDGKNIEAIFMTTPADSQPESIHNAIGRQAMNDAIERFAMDSIDINTLLRETEEIINSNIEAELAGN